MATQVPIIDVIQRALRDAGIPIDGVSVGKPETDRSQWGVSFLDAATPQQRGQAVAILQALDPQDVTIVAELKADTAGALVNMDVVFALGQACYECAQSPATFPTLVSFRNRFLIILRNRL